MLNTGVQVSLNNQYEVNHCAGGEGGKWMGFTDLPYTFFQIDDQNLLAT